MRGPHRYAYLIRMTAAAEPKAQKPPRAKQPREPKAPKAPKPPREKKARAPRPPKAEKPKPVPRPLPAIHCAYKVLRRGPDAFTPHPRNPNAHPERQLKLLASVIVGTGWRAPITVSARSGLVTRGHGRLLALPYIAELCQVDVETLAVPVDVQDYASEAEELADVIADNRLAELADMSKPNLRPLIDELLKVPDFDVELTGFNRREIDDLLTVPSSTYAFLASPTVPTMPALPGDAEATVTEPVSFGVDDDDHEDSDGVPAYEPVNPRLAGVEGRGEAQGVGDSAVGQPVVSRPAAAMGDHAGFAASSPRAATRLPLPILAGPELRDKWHAVKAALKLPQDDRALDALIDHFNAAQAPHATPEPGA